MEDKNKLLNVVREIWEVFPELRLMQLLMNVAYIENGCTRDGLYYITDDLLTQALIKSKEGKSDSHANTSSITTQRNTNK